jgi:drug/metabolite transporter (DMT)-like permease
MMRQRLAALAALVGAMVLVGSSVAVGRLVVAELPIYFASMVRFALATAVLVPLVLVVEGGWPGVSRRGLVILFGQALCGSFLFTICLLGGLRLTGAAQAGVVSATTPAAVALMGRLFFRERLSGRAWLGLGATVVGLAALEAGGKQAAGPAPMLGNVLVLGAVLFEAVFLLLRRVLPDPLSPLAAAMWVSLLGLVLFLVPGIAQAARLDPAALTPARLAALAYYGLGVTAVAYMLWFYGVVRVDAALAGVVTGVMPVAALGFAAWLCGEAAGGREYAGCAGVLAGLLLLAGRKR